MKREFYKIDRNGIKRYVRESEFAKTATRNFLAAFGVYLVEHGYSDTEIYDAFSEIDGLMARDDNLQKLEESVGIRLVIDG